MNTIDLSGLIKGLMVVIGIAVSMGKLPELKRWATHEAFDVHSDRHGYIQWEKVRNPVGKHLEKARKLER